MNTFKYDLIVEKPDQAQFNDLIRSFILAGVPDITILQDSILFSVLYRDAVKNKIKYFLSGFNFSLEIYYSIRNGLYRQSPYQGYPQEIWQIPLDEALKCFRFLTSGSNMVFFIR